jgi:hypothetical protein
MPLLSSLTAACAASTSARSASLVLPCRGFRGLLAEQLIDVGQFRQGEGRHLLARDLLDLPKQIAFFTVAERDREALLAHSARTTDAVHV